MKQLLKRVEKLCQQFDGHFKLITNENIKAYQSYEEDLIGHYRPQLPFEPEADSRYLFKNMAVSRVHSYIIIGITEAYALNRDSHQLAYGIVDYSAWQNDYHEVLADKIEAFRRALEDEGRTNLRSEARSEQNAELSAELKSEAKPYALIFQEQAIDTSPYIERELGFLLGLGTYGINQMLIHPKWGTCFNMGFIIYGFKHDEGLIHQVAQAVCPEALESRIDVPKVYEGCRDCMRCIKVCPAQILGHGQKSVNRRECLSYLTQSKESLSLEQAQRMNHQLYGCSLCQKVCPANQGIAYHPFLQEKDNLVSLEALLKMTNKSFKQSFSHKGFTWRGLRVMKRNALILLGNHPYLPLIEWVLKQDQYTKEAFYTPYIDRLREIINNPS